MPDFGTSDLDDLQALMDSYTVHATGANEPPTLMEIAGFPRWENVYSNILAFLAQFRAGPWIRVTLHPLDHGDL